MSVCVYVSICLCVVCSKESQEVLNSWTHYDNQQDSFCETEGLSLSTSLFLSLSLSLSFSLSLRLSVFLLVFFRFHFACDTLTGELCSSAQCCDNEAVTV